MSIANEKRMRADFPLLVILVLSAVLNVYGIWKEVYANTYYTMAVGSMLQSFHNFFFASLDSAGSVTIDKPPVTFWIQTLFAYVFGLHGWSVILPQALAGIGSVLLIYRLVKPSFGLAAARIAALAMALTPVAVAVSRTNNIDSMLVFTLLSATVLLFRGVRTGGFWSLIGAFALIGVGFNMKMLEAYMVVPAFLLFYLFAAKESWKTKLGRLSAGVAVLLVVSLSWAVVVDSIPADKRPYIGSSKTNSVLELAFGYNGLSRLTGNKGPGRGRGGFTSPNRADDGASSGQAWARRGADVTMSGQPGDGRGAMDGRMPDQGQAPDGSAGAASGPDAPGGVAGSSGFGGFGGPGGPGGSGGMFGTGQKGPLRLFQAELSGQASWLLPFVGFGCIALLEGLRRRRPLTRKQQETLFWLAWLIPGMIFFSVAGFFHPYYLIMLAPPIAALVGAGWSEMTKIYRSKSGLHSWLLPAAVAGTAALEWYIVHPYDQKIGSGWSTLIAAGGIVATAMLILFMRKDLRLSRPLAVAGLLLLFAGPLYWSATPIAYGQNSMMPQAGPGVANDARGMGRGNGGRFWQGSSGRDGNPVPQPGAGSTGRPNAPFFGAPGPEGSSGVDPKTLSYLKEHNTGEKYLFAAMDYGTAAPYIIDKGEKVISLNGFSGSDPVYTVEKLEAMVRQGEVKYFLVSGGGMGGFPGRGGQSELTQWIREHGTEIPSDQWKSANSGTNGRRGGMMPGGFGGSATLYEVKK